MPLFKGKSKKDFAHNVKEEVSEGKPQKQALAIAYSMKKKKKASGGTVESGDAEMNYADGGQVSKEEADKFAKGLGQPPDQPGPQKMSAGGNPYSKMEESQRPNMADGGEVNPMMEVTCPHCTKSFSHGGQVANSDEPMADGLPNEFDDLHLRDDLEFSETGANSGDKDGDAEEDKLRKDVVSRAMIKRRAKKND